MFILFEDENSKESCRVSLQTIGYDSRNTNE